jgi:SAM-dependent methyltransferase
MKMAALLVASYRRLLSLIVPEQFLIRRFIARQLAAAVLPQPVVLDVGAGTGPYRSALVAATAAAKLWNLDLVQRDVTDLVADAEGLPISNNSIGLVSLFHVVQHLPRPDTALREAARVCAPGGLLMVDFPFMTCEGRSSDLRRWSMAGMALELSQAGFEVVSVRRVGGFLFLLSSTLADMPGRLLIRHQRGWQAGRGPFASFSLLAAFVLALPFHLLGFVALCADGLLPAGPYYTGGLILARKAAR